MRSRRALCSPSRAPRAFLARRSLESLPHSSFPPSPARSALERIHAASRAADSAAREARRARELEARKADETSLHRALSVSCDAFECSIDEASGAAASVATNWALRGNFAPVRAERAFAELECVEGAIPRDLRGTFLRIGPDAQFDPRGGHHWFDGDGMVHAVRLADATASYANSWVRTARFELERALGRPVALRLGDLEGFAGLLKILLVRPARAALGEAPPKARGSTANTNVVAWDGRLFAMNEQDLPCEIALGGGGGGGGGDDDDAHAARVETKGFVDFGGAASFAMIAHPRVCARTGELVCLGYELESGAWDGEYAVLAPGGGARVAGTKLRFRRKTMVHDIAITRKYTVIPEGSFVYDPAKVVDGAVFSMREEQPLRFLVLPRYATKPEDAVAFDTDAPGFVLHVMHAHDEGDDAIVVVGSATRDFSLKFGGAPHHLYRWRLDLRTREVSRETIDARFIEFPRVRDGLDGARARYGYGARMRRGQEQLSDGPVKYDLDKREPVAQVDFGAGVVGGEMVFAPRAGAAGGRREDDGYLIGFVHDEARESSELLILDARTMDEKPVARVTIPGRVPHGFHALWVPDDEGEEHHPRSKLF